MHLLGGIVASLFIKWRFTLWNVLGQIQVELHTAAMDDTYHQYKQHYVVNKYVQSKNSNTRTKYLVFGPSFVCLWYP